MQIVWDEIRRQSNLAKHGLDFADLHEEFFLGAMIAPMREGRYLATGDLGEAILSVAFRPLGAEAISIISMRQASRRERRNR